MPFPSPISSSIFKNKNKSYVAIKNRVSPYFLFFFNFLVYAVLTQSRAPLRCHRCDPHRQGTRRTNRRIRRRHPHATPGCRCYAGTTCPCTPKGERRHRRGRTTLPPSHWQWRAFWQESSRATPYAASSLPPCQRT
jgi:hypothetical protein